MRRDSEEQTRDRISDTVDVNENASELRGFCLR
jgi:hypothetical protein